MERKFKKGDRVYHRSLKAYGTFVEYDALWGETDCYVDFDTEDGGEDCRRVSHEWLDFASEQSK